MAGLLDGAQPDPLGTGLLNFGAALMTPRQLGGGVPNAMLAFNQGAMQAQQMRRQAEMDAMRRKLLESQIAENAAEVEDRRAKRTLQQQLQAAAARAYTPASAGSLGGGVAPGSEQGRMLLEQGSGDPEFDAAMLRSTNAALNSVGPRQSISAPTAGGFDQKRFLAEIAQVAPIEAMRLMKEQKAENPLGKIDPKDYTPESFSAFMRTGDATHLRRYEAPQKVESTPMERALSAAGIDPKSPQGLQLLRSYATKTATHAPPTNVSVNTAFPKQMAAVDADIAKGDMAKWEGARAARNSLRSIMQASPGAASGPMANAAVSGIDFLSSLGIASDQLQKVSADTAQFNSQATELVLANIKRLGANPSNADLNEIKKLVPQITTSKAARDRVAGLMLKYTNRAELDAKHRFNYIQSNQGSAGWNPIKVNEMPTDRKALMPGALYQHPATQEIAVYKGNGQFETVVGDD